MYAARLGGREYADMQERIKRLGLKELLPGFYDAPEFLAAERRDKTMLDAYATFVEELAFTPAYLRYARERVAQTAEFLSSELIREGRQGACLDVSQTLSRFLERQGVWNYIAMGALTLTFEPSLGIPRRNFWALASGSSLECHSWLRVPPFDVVDLTMRQQAYLNGEGAHLPDTVLLEGAVRGRAQLDDVLPPDLCRRLERELGHRPSVDDLRVVQPLILERMSRYGCWELNNSVFTARYVATSVTAPDLPLERAQNLCLSGRFPNELWREFVRTFSPPRGFGKASST